MRSRAAGARGTWGAINKTSAARNGAGGSGTGVRAGGGPGGAGRNGAAGGDAGGGGPTIVDAIRLAQRYLEDHGVESARLSAESLLAKALGCSRLDLYLRFGEVPGRPVLARYREQLKRRAGHYPLQYLLGEIEFFSRSFAVREGVFIPRPETELLVEWIGEILPDSREVSFLEFGVGAGVISGTLAVLHPRWRGVAFDVCATAAALSRENFEALSVADRIALFVADGFDALSFERRYDLVVANPPYIPSIALPALQEEVSRYENAVSLDGGQRGLVFYPLIAKAGAGLLRRGGLLALEIGDGQAREIERILGRYGYEQISMRRDYNGYERMMTAFNRTGTEG